MCCFDIPITYFNNFLVRDNSNPNFPSSLILNSNYNILSKIRLEVANSDLSFNNTEIVDFVPGMSGTYKIRVKQYENSTGTVFFGLAWW